MIDVAVHQTKAHSHWLRLPAMWKSAQEGRILRGQRLGPRSSSSLLWAPTLTGLPKVLLTVHTGSAGSTGRHAARP